MPAARYISLSEAEDKQLQAIEHDAQLNEKLRLRAKVIRLSNLQMSTSDIASYTGRHLSSITRDYNRWEEKGIAGLADGRVRGQPSPVNEEAKKFLVKKLSEERSWTAQQLAEALNASFKLKVNRETMRVCLQNLGYSWQRHRYVPVKEPDAELLASKKEEFEVLKKEPKRAI